MGILDLFEEFDSDVICVEDLGIIRQGCLITHIALTDDKRTTLWSGNPKDDEFAEEIVLSEEDWRLTCEGILEEML